MTFGQRRNRLTTDFSESIPAVKRRISVCLFKKYIATRVSHHWPSSDSHYISTITYSEIHIDFIVLILNPIPVAARSKAWVCGRSLAGIAGSNPAGGMGVCLL